MSLLVSLSAQALPSPLSTSDVIALRKENIGMIAEEIYNLLKERGELSISEVISETKTPPHIAYLGMGWLAREDKLEFVKREGRNFVHLT